MNRIEFANPGFWPWLLVLGIPVLIHLLTRQTRKSVVLPTFLFVQRSLAQQSKLFRLRRKLLLALRLLFLTFLVLAFLKPGLQAPLAAADGRRRAVVLILDTSLSMGFVRGGVSSLGRVRAQSGEILEDLRRGDVANVIFVGTTPRSVLAQPGSDFGALQRAVKEARPTAERSDLSSAVALGAEMLAAVRQPHKELIVASDFQRTTSADARFDTLPSDVRLVLLDAGADSRENTAVVGLKLRPASPRTGDEAAVTVEVWNGTPAMRTVPVTLSMTEGLPAGGAPVAEGRTLMVTAPPYATAAVTFPVVFPRVGRYQITARIPTDALPADDVRYLVADLRHGQTVLLLTDAPLRSPSAAYFLMRAFNPLPDQPGGVRVLARRPAELTETDLKICDAVVLCSVSTMPADSLPRLYRYVSQGGALMIFLVNPKSIDQMEALARLAYAGEGPPFLPLSAVDVRAKGKGYVTLAEARYDSPLLKLFKDPGTADLGKIHVTRFFMTSEPDPRAEILLKYEDGTPAAARRNIGAGSLLVCNFSPAPADSDLARQEVFPPLMHEFLKGLTTKEGERRESYVGSPASGVLDAPPAPGRTVAVGPNGESEPVTVDRTGGGIIVEKTAAPGFHTVLSNGQPVAVLAVNTHPDESDLRAIDPRELESRRNSGRAYRVHSQEMTGAAELEALRRARPLWPYCILLAFAALLLEQMVTAFGSRARIRAVDDSDPGRSAATV